MQTKLQAAESSVLLDKMSGFEFEDLVAQILTRLGYGHVEKVLYTQDEGRDILIHSPSGLIVVECKHHPKGSIGRPIVQKLHSAIITSKAAKGMLVTTGHFTQEALDYAKKLDSSGTLIEMIDHPLLSDMASRANITLVSGKRVLTVWTYDIPTYSKSENAICNYVTSIASSYPRRPHALLSNTNRKISYRPVYLVSYNVHSTFQTSVGIIHQETANNATIALDGDNGYRYEDSIIDFLKNETQTRFSQPHEEFVGTLPTFKINATELNRMAKSAIFSLHTRNISYWGRNNQRYTKVCTPGDRDIFISDIRQIYLPLVHLRFRLGSVTYHIDGAQAPSGRLLSTSDNLRVCRICNQAIDEDVIICDVCGKITHSGGFLIRSIHGFRCKKCGRTTCRDDGYWRRRYLFFKELLCPDCFEKSKKQGIILKKFAPLDTN